MHVEGVAAGHALGPAGPAEGVAAHHGAEAREQGLGEPGLHRRERHPAGPEAQHAVVVEAGTAEPGPQPPVERLDPGVEVDLVGRHPDPVLELVVDGRRRDRPPRAAAGGRPPPEPTRALPRRRASAPARHPSPGDRTDGLFRACFADGEPSAPCTVRPLGWRKEDGLAMAQRTRTSTTSARSPCSRLCPARSSSGSRRAVDELTVTAGHRLVTQGDVGREMFVLVEARPRSSATTRSSPPSAPAPRSASCRCSTTAPAPPRSPATPTAPCSCWAPGSSRPCSTTCRTSPTRCSPGWRHGCDELDSKVYG